VKERKELEMKETAAALKVILSEVGILFHHFIILLNVMYIVARD
jgi:hypothetical protein